MLAAAIFCMFVIVSMAPFSSSCASAVPVKELRIGFSGKVESLNPFLGLNEESLLFRSFVYDSLQSVDEDMNPIGNLATEWWIVPSSDPKLVLTGEPYGSVWQYNLTTNAVWHDGIPFTADDVVFTVNLNCENYNEMFMFQRSSYFMQYVEKVDNYSVRVHYYDRETGTPMVAAHGYMVDIPIMPKHLLEGMTPTDISFGWDGRFQDSSPPIVGTGPYMATSSVYEDWMAGDRLTLVRNPDYHFEDDRGLTACFDRVVMKFFDDPIGKMLSIENNELEIARLSPDEYRELEAKVGSGTQSDIVLYEASRCDGDALVASFCIGGNYWWGTNPNPMICDRIVRHAIELATDRDAVVDDGLLGYATRGSTLVSPTSPWHYELSPVEMAAHDPEAANELLENSGYVDTDEDGIREATATSYSVENSLAQVGEDLNITLVVAKNQAEMRIAEMLRSQWLEAGIRVLVKVIDETILPIMSGWGDYDVAISHRATAIDPTLPLIHCSCRLWDGWADSRWFNRSFEENLNYSVRAMGDQVRYDYVDECQRIHYGDKPQIVLAYPHCTYALRTDLYNQSVWGNWSAHPGLSLDNTWGAHPLLFQDLGGDENDPFPWFELALVAGLICAVAAVVVVLRLRYQKKPRPPAA